MARRFLIVDDHPLFRAALIQTLGAEGIEIAEAPDLKALDTLLASDRDWDVVLLDLNVPGANGLSGLLLLRAEHPELPVVIVSAVADPAVIRQALQAGASGYLVKSAQPSEIRSAVNAVLAGEIHVPEGVSAGGAESDGLVRRMTMLTPQQLRVLSMMSAGLMNKQIAHELSISEATVKAHVSAILQKLDVDTRTQAVLAAGQLAQAATSG
jgi:DNA-binding NarL/FixJ family response regulator